MTRSRAQSLGAGNKFHLDKIEGLLDDVGVHLGRALQAATCEQATSALVEAAKHLGEAMGHADSTTSPSRRDDVIAEQLADVTDRFERVRKAVLKCSIK